ncbi:MAG: DUF1799 domain-containing protein [Pseudomonadota bacterium]
MDKAFAWADEPDQVAETPGFALLPDGSFPVWPENIDAIAFFLTVQRCWIYLPRGGITGMNWTMVRDKMGMNGFGRRRQAALLPRLETIENAIMEVWY